MTKPRLTWLTAKDALALIRSRIPVMDDSAADLLLDGICSGALSVRGRAVDVEKGERDGSILLALHGGARSGQPVQTFLRNSKCPALRGISQDESLWTLPHSAIVTSSSENDRWNLLLDVEIREKDLASFMRTALNWPEPGDEGAPRKAADWRRFYAAVIQLERSDQLNEKTFKDDGTLMTRLLFEIDSVLEERTLRDDVAMIYDKFVRNYRGRS